MVVKFYKTKYNGTNRPFDEASFNASYTEFYEIDTTTTFDKPVLPDVPFYISAQQADGLVGKGYNYIKFEYAGRTYYSFIVAFVANAPNGGYRVEHHTDLWITFKNDIQLSGVAKRAHINDLRKSSNSPNYLKPLYDYMNMDSVEFDVDRSAFTVKSYPKIVSNIVKRRNGTDAVDSVQWVYVLVNMGNDDKINADNDKLQRTSQHQSGWIEKYKTEYDEYNIYNGYNRYQLYCLPCINGYRSDGCVYTDGDTYVGIGGITDTEALSKLTSSYIVSMFVTDIPPVTCTYSYSDVGLMINCADMPYKGTRESKGTRVVNGYTLTLYDFDQISGLQFALFKNVEIKKTEKLITAHGINSETQLISVNNYNSNSLNIDDYLYQCIVKLRTSAYQPFIIKYLGNAQAIRYEYSKDGYITYGMDMNLTMYYFTMEMYNSDKYNETFTFAISTQLTPITINDYWTRLNAKASTELARIQKDKTEFNAVYGTISEAVMAPIKSMAKFFSGDPVGAITNGAQSIWNTAGSIVNSVYSIEYQDLAYETTAKNNQRIIEEGIRQTVVPAEGALTIGMDTPVFTSIDFRTDKNMHYVGEAREVAYNLHKYGYLTQINIENYFIKHKRKHFNFLSCSIVNVYGLPANYASELEKMLANGCTFWYDEPLNYDRPNQIENIEVIDYD